MTAEHLDARRAATLLELLESRPGWLTNSALERSWQKHDLTSDLDNSDSVGRARRKAVQDLRDLGHEVEVGDRRLRLVLRLPAESPTLRATADEWMLCQQISQLLDVLNPDLDRFPDPKLAIKDHVGRDRLALGYGELPDPIEGIPYDMETGDRDRLLISTEEGDQALYVDAIRSIRVVLVGAAERASGGQAPPVIDAEPCTAPVRPLRQGRPPTTQKLRDAYRLITEVARHAHDRDVVGRLEISVDTLSSATAIDPHRVRDLLPVATLLSGYDFCDEDGQVAVYRTEVRRPRAMSGSEALAAWLDASALAELDGAQEEMRSPFDQGDLRRWLDTLTAFLSRMSFQEPSVIYPCAREIVAAREDNDVLRIQIAGDPRMHVLRPEGLSWTGYRWRVHGYLDDERLGAEGLPLDAITAAHPT